MNTDIKAEFSLKHSGILKFKNMTRAQRFRFYRSMFRWGGACASFPLIMTFLFLIWSWDDVFSRLVDGAGKSFFIIVFFMAIGMWVRLLKEFPGRVMIFNCQRIILKELRPMQIIQRTELEYVVLSELDNNEGTRVCLPTSPPIEITTSTDIETITTKISRLGYRVKTSDHEENSDRDSTNLGPECHKSGGGR